MGHYIAARKHAMHISLPYFIPVPFALGTFGAFISLRSPAPSRRALFDMAVAGPLAGLVFAVPALLIGLPMSTVSETAPTAMAMHNGGVPPPRHAREPRPWRQPHGARHPPPSARLRQLAGAADLKSALGLPARRANAAREFTPHPWIRGDKR